MGISLIRLWGNQLLDVENERQHRGFPPNCELGRAVLAGDPCRVVLWSHYLRWLYRTGDVAWRARREVLNRFSLHCLTRSHDHNVAHALAAQILHKACHQVGLAYTGSEVENLLHLRVVIAIEREDELTECFFVGGSQIEIRADRL